MPGPGSFLLSVRRLTRFFKSALSSALYFGICFGLTFAPLMQAQALELELKDWRSIRLLNNDNQDYVANLAPGSVVEIPDQFKVMDANGGVNAEQSLYRWLKQAGGYGGWGNGHSPGFYKYSETQGDYYYPVKVKHVAPGSKDAENIDPNKSYFTALGRLAMKKNLLVVTESAPLTNSIPSTTPATTESKPAAPPAVAETRKSLEAGCAVCGHETVSHEAPRSNDLQNLMAYMKPALDAANKQMQHHETRTADDLKDIRARFRNSCGISLESFIPEVKRQGDEAGIPASVLLSIMTQESSGRCNQVTQENVGVSVGLFQIHESIFRQCSSGELLQMQGASVSQLRRSPRCLQNPIVNLSEGIRVIKQKTEALLQASNRYSIDRYSHSGGVERVGIAVRGFDAQQLRTPDGRWNSTMWRLVASAYNGGEAWVLRAKRDLELYNQRNGTSLSPYNWEDLRVFYLKRQLNRYDQVPEQFFGHREVGRRVDSATLNLSYAENVQPRDRNFRPTDDVTLSDRWQRIISTF